MGRVTRSALIASAACAPFFLSASCNTSHRLGEIGAPLAAEHFTLARKSGEVQITLKESGVTYRLSNSFCALIESELRESDKKIIYTTDLLARAAPLADLNGDCYVGMREALTIAFSKEHYNNLVDVVNSYFPEERPRFSRR